jgi:outer membrane protein TolC
MKPVSATILIVCAAIAARGVAEVAPRALTLPEAIALALQHSPDLAAAKHRIATARAYHDQTYAALWPHIRLSASYAASDNPVQAFMMTLNQRAFNFGANFNNPDTTDNLNGKVLAQYSLYDGGNSSAQRQATRLVADAVETNLDAVRDELILEVTRAYHHINQARQFILTSEAAVGSMEANRKLAADRQEAGKALKNDVLNADVRLAESRENLVRARTSLALAETVFRNIIGVGENDPVTASTDFPSLDRSAQPVADTTPPDRPEIHAMRKIVAAAEKQIRAAQSGQRPRVRAFASYDLDSGNAYDFEDSWVAGVSVELDVFDGFLTRGKVAAARAEADSAREQLRKLELGIQLEVRQAYLNLSDSLLRVETTAKSVALAEESLQLTRDRYAGGLALFTQVLDADAALTAARQRHAAARSDVLIARAVLEKALGTIAKESQ